METASLSMLTSWDSLARGKKIGLRSNLEEGLAGNIGVVICGLIVLVKPILRLEIPVFLPTSNRFYDLTDCTYDLDSHLPEYLYKFTNAASSQFYL